MKLKLIWHPYLFALYGVLATIASNITYMHIGVLKSLAASLLVSVVLVIALRLILKDSLKAGLISSGFILLLFSYGHVQILVRDWTIAGFSLSQHAIILPLWATLFAVWVAWILRRTDQTRSTVSGYLNWVGLISIALPILTITRFNRINQQIKPWVQKYPAYAWQQGGVNEIRSDGQAHLTEARPDIYYIILDAYTRDDVLAELYGYDNTPFLDFLRSRGFTVATSSRANYTYTNASLASSLNMVHVSTMPQYFRDNAGVKEAWVVEASAVALLSKSRVVDFLKAHGYRFVDFTSGYGGSLAHLADQTIVPPYSAEVSNSQIIFNLLLWDTLFEPVFASLPDNRNPIMESFRAHRENILYVLDSLPEVAKEPGPNFVFAHVLAPHVPFVFGPNGEEIENVDPFTLTDSHPGSSHNISLYRGQVNYLNLLVEKAIDGILANSQTPPIIILQGDHGSKVYKERTPPLDVRMKLLLPNLNAYKLPNAPDKLIYPTITPVNSFRVLFDYYFGANLDRLDDDSYVLEVHKGQVEYVNACRVYDACLER